MIQALRVTGIMASRIKLRSLTKIEQRQLWQDFKPLKDALSLEVKKSFGGGWKKLNLRAARARIKNTSEILRAEKAMQQLIAHNTAMVISEAHRKHRRNNKLNPDDLIQAGHIGLIYALYLYEPVVDGKEIKFSSYAYRWIKALIQEEAQGDRQIKPPSNERDYKYRFVTQLKANDGGVVDVFDVLDNDEPKLLSVRCADVLDDREYTALTEEPLMAMLTLGVDWEKLDEICRQGKEKVLASI
jgi:hypothetical protein